VTDSQVDPFVVSVSKLRRRDRNVIKVKVDTEGCGLEIVVLTVELKKTVQNTEVTVWYHTEM
jgi:hypothetical protein